MAARYSASVGPSAAGDAECRIVGYSEERGERKMGETVERQVAALFVMSGGCYTGLPYVDAWTKERDALNYQGPFPVVAHPPCQLWGALASVNYARWGGEHNRPGNDGGCFAFALNAVRKWCGILEHPAKTRAFAAYGLPAPSGIGWQRIDDGGWICEVWQSAYGHQANKATWLYYFGSEPPFQLSWERPTGTHQIGFHDQRGKAANKPTLSRKEANATPVAFRDVLLRLAASSVCPVKKGSGNPPENDEKAVQESSPSKVD